VSDELVRPQDVSAADASRVLAFLNGAETAAQIAERIELPNEPDVGPKLGARLLAHRQQHGPFTDVAQLLDVPLIGPVRFDRVVRSLSAATAPQLVEQAAFDALAAQVTSLRTALEALQAKHAAVRPDHLIAPSDVTAADATAILAFLNAASSAQEIAARIELPDEPDVGLKLGARLLAYRGEHGPFTALGQLLAVPLIGPVRFDRIVRSLTTQPDVVPERVVTFGGAQAAGPRVTLRGVEGRRYLGQPLTLVATVAGGGAGVPVTLTTTWGRLAGSDGFSVANGTTITLRTAGDGTVRARLLAPTAEDLQETQQASLELHLAKLDPAAATPQDAADALGGLASAYRFEANDAFRTAVDIYFRDFHPHLLDSINFRDALQEWSSVDAAVVAYVQEPDTTSVTATAALVAQFRDWLPALVQTHTATTAADTLFEGDLHLATNLTDPSDVLSRIHRRVGDFVSLQQGVLGQAVAQQVADAKLGDFLSTGLDALPDDHKQLLFPAVATSSDTVGTLGVQALGAIEQTRTDVRETVAAQVDQSPAITSLQAALASKVDATALSSALANKVDVATLKDQLAAASDFSAFKSSLGNVFKLFVPNEIGPLFKP
jgi:DNA uptake protein ComE-like DNA-binding protein